MVHKPTIHLNGSGAENLLNQYHDCWEALDTAVKVLCRSRPHGRDYYPQDNGGILGPTYMAARNEHENKIQQLESMLKDFAKLAQHVQRFQDHKKNT
jgi:hypothetical protein